VKRTLGLIGLVMLALGIIAEAKPKQDEEAVRKLPQAFCDAWAKHHGHELAKIMAEDVDFVTVGATWFHGRADFEKYHTRLLNGRFKETRMRTAPPTQVAPL
jgi:uncharacterized protein (TIGR02246 family)